jgi:hypothetical protein
MKSPRRPSDDEDTSAPEEPELPGAP